MAKFASILLSLLRQDNSIHLDQVSAQDWQELIDLSFEQGVDALSVDGYHKCLDSGIEESLLETDEELEDLKFEWFGSVLQAEEDYRNYETALTDLADIFAKSVCHEKKYYQVGHLMMLLRNFERDGGRPTAYGVQAQFANHFVRLEGKLTGRERQLEG